MANVIQGPRGAAASQMLWIDNGDGSFSPQVKLVAGSFSVGSVDDGGGSLTVDDGGLALSVDDNGSTLSVDDGGGTLSIDDGGGSITVDGSVTISSVPASARTTDSISAAVATDALMSSTTVLTPKFAKISAASSGNNTLVSAVSSKTIRVVSLFLVATAAVSVYFVDGAGTPIALAGDSTNKISVGANGGFVLPFNPVGWFQTSTTNVNLNLNLSGAIAVAGSLGYLEV